MSSTDGAPGDVTRLLQQVSGGDRQAFDSLVAIVYSELSALAHRRLRSEAPGHTLSTTALVHEAYLRLAGEERSEWRNREHFLAVASEAMRRVLVDHARRRRRHKRAGNQVHVSLDEVDALAAQWLNETQAEDLMALDDALTRLAAFNPDGARVVEMRFFGGLSNDEVAQALGSSERTVRRSWSVAKAWLRRELGGRDPGSSRVDAISATPDD